MRRPSFSVALTFVYGGFVGAFALLLFLQLTGRLDLDSGKGSADARRGSTQEEQADDDRIVVPVAGVKRSDLKSSWGAARGGRTHGGIDIRAPKGTRVLAAVGGKVLQVHRSKAGGITIYTLDKSGKWLFYYAHLSAFRVGLAAGDEIETGEMIGYVGSSGNAQASNPHLHFAIERMPESGDWRDAKGVDPHPILLDGKLPDDSEADAR